MTMQLGLPFSLCCLICLEFPFSRLIPLLGSHLYVCTHTFIYSHPLNPTWFYPALTKVRADNKNTGPFLLLHFRCIFLYSIHNVFHSLFACKLTMCISLCSCTVTFYPRPYFASTHKCMPAQYSTPNTAILTLSQAPTPYHTTGRTVISLIMALIASSPSHSFADQLKLGTNWTLPNVSLVFKQLSAFTENINHLEKSPFTHFFPPPGKITLNFLPG